MTINEETMKFSKEILLKGGCENTNMLCVWCPFTAKCTDKNSLRHSSYSINAANIYIAGGEEFYNTMK